MAEAVKLKPISPRPHNNLGRVLLRESQVCETDARKADAKNKSDPAEAVNAIKLREQAKAKIEAAVKEFERAIELDPNLLEARLNLGEIYLSFSDRDKAGNNLDKAENEYRAVLNLRSASVKDQETINNFSQASFGLARVALVRKHPDEAIRYLKLAIELNPQNVAAKQLLAAQAR